MYNVLIYFVESRRSILLHVDLETLDSRNLPFAIQETYYLSLLVSGITFTYSLISSSFFFTYYIAANLYFNNSNIQISINMITYNCNLRREYTYMRVKLSRIVEMQLIKNILFPVSSL